MSLDNKAHKKRVIFFALVPTFVFMIVEILQGFPPFFGTYNFWIDLLFYYGFAFVVYGLSKSLFLYTIIPGILMWILGVVNHYMIVFRNKPLLPWEIFAVKTAQNIAGNLTLTIDLDIIISVIALVTICVFAWRFRKMELFKRIRLNALVAGFLCLALFAGLILMSFPTIFTESWLPVNISKQNGLVVNLAHSFTALVNYAPDGYSPERVREIVGDNGYETAFQPDIIVIMDESFVDFSQIADLEADPDFIPFFHSIRDNAVTGTVRVSVFGGGTCNSEYDFLTGNASPLVRMGSYPMVQFVNENNPSIARSLQSRGYRTIGIHPFDPDGWSRETSYPRLGFDKFLSNHDFENPEMVREFISDAESFDKIIEVLEEDPSKPAFIFNVTMQNHTSYDESYDNFVEDANFPEKKKYPAARRYFSLISLTDRALEDLVTYLEARERPTILLFFGDHFPKIEDGYYDTLQDRAGLDDDTMTKYIHTTPFFIWANYPIEEKHDMNISVSYLSAILLDTAGVSMTDYQSYLYDLSTKMPIWEEGDVESIREYEMVQYNMVFDEEAMQGDLFE